MRTTARILKEREYVIHSFQTFINVYLESYGDVQGVLPGESANVKGQNPAENDEVQPRQKCHGSDVRCTATPFW